MNQGFESFKQKLNDFFQGEYPSELCVEVMYDIVEGKDVRYEFDFEHLRLTQDLLLSAVLLSEWKKLNVVFLTPTTYYAAQAIRMVKGYQKAGVACPTLSVGVAGIIPSSTLIHADVILYHGRVYGLPENVRPQRTIIQIFKNEDVPHDTRSLRMLYCDD